jgi:hypothetical protein
MKIALYTITLLFLAVIIGGWAVDNVQAQASWYDSDWDYRQKITIASSQVDSNLTDFPVYVDLATMSSGFFSNIQSDGGDIRVTKSDGTTEVAREVVSIDTASSTGELHFKAPSVCSSTDTEFYIYYGNDSAIDYSQSATYGAENVWTNSQAGVWHLGEDSGDVIDSTSNNNDGTTNGGVTQGVGGQVGQAYDFDGSDDSIDIGDRDEKLSQDAWTVAAWVKPNALKDWGNIVGAAQPNGSYLRPGGYISVDADGNLRDYDGSWMISNGTIAKSEWSFVAFQFQSDNTYRMFIDGALDTKFNNTSSENHDDGVFYMKHIGKFGSGVGRYFNGKIDNVRIYNQALTDDEITTAYTNQNSPTTFYTVGSEETESSQVVMESSNYQIQRDSINSGGIDVSTSSSYAIRDTVGEQATGLATSSRYQLRGGYRQMAESSIAVSAPGSVTLPAIGGVVGGSSETTADVNVTTDSPGGYELKVRATTSPALASGEDSFADYSAGSNPDFSFQIASSESVFGYTPEGADVADEFLDDGSNCGTGSQDSQSACWRGFATTDRVIAESTDNNQPSGTETTLRLQAESGEDNIQTSGQYNATIVVTGVAL